MLLLVTYKQTWGFHVNQISLVLQLYCADCWNKEKKQKTWFMTRKREQILKKNNGRDMEKRSAY